MTWRGLRVAPGISWRLPVRPGRLRRALRSLPAKRWRLRIAPGVLRSAPRRLAVRPGRLRRALRLPGPLRSRAVPLGGRALAGRGLERR